MIPLKTKREISIMKKGGQILAKAMKLTLAQVKPGIKTRKLDQIAENFIRKHHAFPAFKMVNGYHFASCININDGLVHGIPNDYQIKKGDLVTIDLGVYYQGFNTDMARTILVGSNQEKERFLKAGQLALEKAKKMARAGRRVGHISQTIEKIIKAHGYRPSLRFTGHGVGKKLHEEPVIPCFLKEPLKKTPLLKTGMTLAIEVIYTQGQPETKTDKDGWTARTIDGKWGGLFEDTVAITQTGTITLTML